jgi:hypothetical protein
LTTSLGSAHYIQSMPECFVASDSQDHMKEAASLIRSARYLTDFTGAGITAWKAASRPS